MSKISLSPSPTGSAVYTIASPAGSTDRTLNLPDNSGTLLSNASTFAGTGPAFSANKNAIQSLSVAAFTKILFQVKNFDTNTNFSLATSRFTPTVAGYYQVNANVSFESTNASVNNVVSVFKNGAEHVRGSGSAITAGQHLYMSAAGLIFLDGSTDYLEVYVFQAGASQTIQGGTPANGFSAALVRAA